MPSCPGKVRIFNLWKTLPVFMPFIMVLVVVGGYFLSLMYHGHSLVSAANFFICSLLMNLCRYPKDHALAQLSGTDNMVCFSTERYSPLPLIVRGPGAGASVTAMGVFSDLLSLAKRLPPLSS